jgi:predicted nuclease of predicted toxin-antitoxin system
VRFLADENIPTKAVEALRAAGHDIESIVESPKGLGDLDVAAIAARNGRTLLTFDQDFGELVAMGRVTLPAGIVLFRVRASDSGDAVSLVVDAIAAGNDWEGRFTVVEHDRIRSAPLPGVVQDGQRP